MFTTASPDALIGLMPLDSIQFMKSVLSLTANRSLQRSTRVRHHRRRRTKSAGRQTLWPLGNTEDPGSCETSHGFHSAA